MPNLRILNLSGNGKLEILPPELATNDNLHDLVFDIENIKSPSNEILSTGTQNILKYLSTGELTAPSDFEAEENAIKQQTQSKITTSRIINESMSSSTKKFLHKEKVHASDFLDHEINETFLKEQQKKKEEMLNALLQQERQQQDAVNKIYLEKDDERKKLIDDIRECENYKISCLIAYLNYF